MGTTAPRNSAPSNRFDGASMLGVPLRYLLKHPLAAAELASDPLGVISRARDIYIAQRELAGPQCRYNSNVNWGNKYLG